MSFSADHAAFLRRFPGYAETQGIDRLREREFPQLASTGQVYLDYGGAALYGTGLVEQHAALLRSSLLGNPHSNSGPSERSRELVDEARDAVCEYFHAGDEYRVVFTSNASHAAKLVGESFPFSRDSVFLMTEDNHNSIVGLSCFARRSRAAVEVVPIESISMRVAPGRIEQALQTPNGPSLFAYPAQSNYSGVKHPLDWLERARRHGFSTLLDAAAFVGTSQLDLSRVSPDFVVVSLYKMFGYPTGVGCLLAREEALASLSRPWFAGGAVAGASPQLGVHRSWEDEARFEEGTANYTSIAAVPLGLGLMKRTLRDVDTRVAALTAWLLERLSGLRHGNGGSLVTVHGPADGAQRGGTVSMTLRDARGRAWDVERLERLASEAGIAVRAGTHCNPGANEVATGTDRLALRRLYEDPSLKSLDDFLWQHGRVVRGALRASLGLVSDFRDVWALVAFLEGLLDCPAPS